MLFMYIPISRRYNSNLFLSPFDMFHQLYSVLHLSLLLEYKMNKSMITVNYFCMKSLCLQLEI